MQMPLIEADQSQIPDLSSWEVLQTYPKYHDDRDEDTRSELLEQDIGQGFKTAIRDEEYC